MADRPTVDFDHHDRGWHAGRVEHWGELRRCPVAFNDRYGGFWVVSGHDEVAAVSRDAMRYRADKYGLWTKALARKLDWE